MANWFYLLLARDVTITPDSGLVLSMKDMLFKRIFVGGSIDASLSVAIATMYNIADPKYQHLPLIHT